MSSAALISEKYQNFLDMLQELWGNREKHAESFKKHVNIACHSIVKSPQTENDFNSLPFLKEAEGSDTTPSIEDFYNKTFILQKKIDAHEPLEAYGEKYIYHWMQQRENAKIIELHNDFSGIEFDLYMPHNDKENKRLDHYVKKTLGFFLDTLQQVLQQDLPKPLPEENDPNCLPLLEHTQDYPETGDNVIGKYIQEVVIDQNIVGILGFIKTHWDKVYKFSSNKA